MRHVGWMSERKFGRETASEKKPYPGKGVFHRLGVGFVRCELARLARFDNSWIQYFFGQHRPAGVFHIWGFSRLSGYRLSVWPGLARSRRPLVP